MVVACRIVVPSALRAWASATVLAASLCGCSASDDPPGKAAPVDKGCVAPALALPDGSCLRPGIPVDGCAPGFSHDGEYGCTPVLPADACPPGRMAVPGDGACRPVAECGAGRWGAIPVEPATTYVDAAYGASDSNGSAPRPFKTVAAAVAAAPDHGMIAIAAGSYVENVFIEGKTLRLWGVCPDQVEIAPKPVTSNKCSDAAVCVQNGSVELHTLALRGGAFGLGAPFGLPNGVVDRVWLHDTSGPGMLLLPVPKTSFAVTGSLIERSRGFGVYLYGVKGTLDKSVVRDTQPRSDKRGGQGLYLSPCGPKEGCSTPVSADFAVTASVVERNREAGIASYGSIVRIDGTVVQGNLARQLDGKGGFGVLASPCKPDEGCTPAIASDLHMTRSWLAHNHTGGVVISGSTAEIAASVVRDGEPSGDGRYGNGIHAEGCYPSFGCPTTLAPTVSLTSSLVDNNHYVGVSLVGSIATIDGSVVRSTLPEVAGKGFGRGLAIVSCSGMSCASSATVSGTLVAHSYEFGVEISDSTATLAHCAILDTVAGAATGGFGDGLSAAYLLHSTATATLDATRIEGAARAGVSAFGAKVSLGSSRVACSGFPLDGEPNGGIDFKFEDRGGNLCGCPAADGACKVESAKLTAPDALTSP